MADVIQTDTFPYLVFIVAGTVNVLLIKWADFQQSIGIDGEKRHFQHPFFQTSLMFFAEFLCFVIYKTLFSYLKRKNNGTEEIHILTSGSRDFRATVLLIPTICDLIASSMLFTGLYFTYGSSFQMLRFSSIVFAALFRINYLHLSNSLNLHQWCGILLISLGTILVVLSDYIMNTNFDKSDSNTVITGDLLIICSQIFQAAQFVYEEKNMKFLNIPPLQAIGLEGLFGLFIILFIHIPLNFLKTKTPFNNNAHGVAEDLPDALTQLFNNNYILLAHIIFIVLTTSYTYIGMSIIKNTSSTYRIVIDMIRSLAIWIFCLIFGWQYFHYMQLIAFITLISGVFVFKNIVFISLYRICIRFFFQRNYGDISEDVVNQAADAI